MADKPTAQVFEASGKKETAMSVEAIGDKCFLCGNEIGEGQPFRFMEDGTMMRGHSHCMDAYDAAGHVWPPKPAEEPAPEVLPQWAPSAAAPKIETVDLGEFRRVAYGKAKLIFGHHQLVLVCAREIAEDGLKTVIPDLIVALRTIEEML